MYLHFGISLANVQKWIEILEVGFVCIVEDDSVDSALFGVQPNVL